MSDTSAPPRLALLREKLLRRFGKGGVLLLAIMAALFVGAVVFTIEAEKPWGRAVQKRLQKNEALKPAEHAVIGMWWAAVASAGVLAVLLGSAGWWMPAEKSTVNGQRPTVNVTKEKKRGHIPEKWVLPLVLGAVL